MEKTPLLESGPEPTLEELRDRANKAREEYMRAAMNTPSARWTRRIALGLVAFVMTLFIFMIGMAVLEVDDAASYPKRVPLEAHIMSKCPDAKDCLHDLILPAMQNVSNKVDFRLSYIGSVSDGDDGVVCKHGPSECLGNILELCVAHMYPNPKIYLGFTMCMTHDFSDIPAKSLVEDCALEHGVDFVKLNHCASEEDGSLGVEMLRRSVERSSGKNVTKSCTVRLNDEIRCIRDGGEWTDCEGGHEVADLVADVERLYRGSMAE
ncbi:hypothetical protein LTR66_002675 [Elasticomyces elasticus]|nr:hypothetical protein LTR66_002675 [Elasticomyces elasticus]